MKKSHLIIFLFALSTVGCKKNTTPASPSYNTKKYTITARAGANGSVDPTGTKTVDAGSNMLYVITPASNYGVATLAIDSKYVPVAESYTFTNVQENHTINAEFPRL